MDDILSHKLDMDALYAFATLARERNMRKAARELHISQPPLSRKIRRLEDCLGLELFTRHAYGMELTEEGKKVLELIRPLLRLAEKTAVKLHDIEKAEGKKFYLGLTTAFDQEIFLPFIKILAEECGHMPEIARKESPRLVKDVLHGRLNAAFVALPVDAAYAADIIALNVNYSERLWAALPALWPEAGRQSLCLAKLQGRPFFWFQRKRNPAYFDHMAAIFKECGFAPAFVEEPAEHDVLLARIAFGEGWALLPQSFTGIGRSGIQFVPMENDRLRLHLAVVCREEAVLEKLQRLLRQYSALSQALWTLPPGGNWRGSRDIDYDN